MCWTNNSDPWEEPPRNIQDLKDLLLTSAVPDTAIHLQESSGNLYLHDLGLQQQGSQHSSGGDRGYQSIKGSS